MLKRVSWMIGVVLVANAGALALVALNSGTPGATLRLTERELRPTNMGTDTTGMTLMLEWDRDAPLWWFDRAKLASVGFDCSVPLDAPGAIDHYSTPSMLPRTSYVVLGLDATPALEGRVVNNKTGYPSRLVPVDAGKDPALLRARYPDRQRYLITAGTVAAHLIRATPTQPARLQGRVQWLDPVQIYVPQGMQAKVAEPIERPAAGQAWSRVLAHPPRYEVTVEYGPRLLPRMVAVQTLQH